MSRPDRILSVSGEALADSGEIVHIKWRAWETNAGRVMIELNKPLCDVHEQARSKAAFEVSTFMSANKHLFEVLLQHFGVTEWQEHIVYSRLSMRRASTTTDGFAKDCYCSSSTALFALLGWFAIAKRCNNIKAKSKALLLTWFRAVLDESLDLQTVVRNLLDDVSEMCTEGNGGGDMCFHLKAFWEQYMRTPAGDDLASQAVAFVTHFLRTVQVDCEALRMAREAFGAQLASWLDAGCASDRFDAQLADLAPEPSEKRRRLDDDWKQQIVNETVAKRWAKSGAAALRCHGNADDSLARRWESKELCAYQASAYRVLRDTRQLCLASDAARLGEPAEETILFAMWSPQSDVGVIGVPQVLPDFHPMVRVSTKGMNFADKRAMDERLRHFLKVKLQQSATGAKLPAKRAGEPNQTHMQALDHCLQVTCGLELKDFAAERPVQALAPFEERYYLASAELPPEVAASGAHRSRSCVIDQRTGACRLEVDWSDDRRTMFEVVDCGSVGFTNKFFLYSLGGIRGCFMGDPAHTRYNRFKQAVKEAHLWEIWLEGSIIIGLRKGPWGAAAHHSQLLDAVRNLEQTQTCDDPLFSVCYESVVADMFKGMPPENINDDTKRKEVWERLHNLPLWEQKGGKAKASRWFNWPQQMKSIGDSLGSLMYVVMQISMQNGWYKTIADTPMYQEPDDQNPPQPAEPNAGSSSSSAPPAPPAAEEESAEAKVQKSRGHAKNTMHLASLILCNRLHILLMKVIYICGAPSQKAHHEHITQTETKSGCMFWWACMSAGSWKGTATDIFATLALDDRLREIGFLGWEVGLNEDDPRYIEEQKAAASTFAFVLALASWEVAEGRMFSESFPNLFGAYLSNDAGERTTAFARSRDMWETSCRAEEASHDNRHLKQYVLDMVWPSQGWIREVLISLSENHWESLPTACHQELRACARGFKSTKCVEDLFNFLRSQERAHTANKLGRCSRWHKAVFSGVLPDVDRALLTATDGDRVSAPSCLPPKMYEAKANQFSLGEECLEKYVDAKSKNWASPKPIDYHHVAIASASLRLVSNDWQKLQYVWQSLLVEPGVYLHNIAEPSEKSGIVLHSTSVGVVLWRLSAHNGGGCRWWSVVQVLITDPSQWKVIEVEPVPPAIMAARNGRAQAAKGHGVVLVPAGSPQDLLQWSCMRALRQLNMGLVKQLAERLGIPMPNPRPRSEFDWVRLVLAHCLPAKEPNELDESVELWRGKNKPGCWTTVLSEKTVDATEGLLDADDVKDVRAAVQEKLAAQRVRSSARAKAKAAARQPRKKVIPVSNELSQAWAKQFLPQVRGCSVHKDTRLHMRWVISYPTEVAPFAKSAVWNESTTQREALLKCLRWAWAHHFEKTGESPEWKFDS